ncbi:unnamed protein product [Phytophthora fragariaefolia]|uniref:Unnamed protein product n=1 Tax=Phytophthora fragariaefolia TaxID=1490495 RepID=A0A9W6YCX6_9STRA|nr:unnamed protein product [Phytophthora fragariaefolia]
MSRGTAAVSEANWNSWHSKQTKEQRVILPIQTKPEVHARTFSRGMNDDSTMMPPSGCFVWKPEKYETAPPWLNPPTTMREREIPAAICNAHQHELDVRHVLGHTAERARPAVRRVPESVEEKDDGTGAVAVEDDGVLRVDDHLGAANTGEKEQIEECAEEAHCQVQSSTVAAPRRDFAKLFASQRYLRDDANLGTSQSQPTRDVSRCDYWLH